MDLTILITMGITSVGGMIVEKILGKSGKIEEASMVGMVTTSMLAVTVIAAVGKVFYGVARLGK